MPGPADRETEAAPPFEMRRGEAPILWTLAAAALGLRLFHFATQGAWLDETFTVSHSGQTLRELFPVLVSDAAQPPLHYLVVHWMFQVVGYGVAQARLISVIAGTLSVPLAYLLVRRFTGAFAALAGVGILALSQIAIYFSQEARPYMLAQALALAAALAFVRYLERPRLGRLAAFFLAALALIYTHYFTVSILAGLGLYWLLYRRQYAPRVFGWLAATAVLLGLAYLPWLAAVGSNLRASDVFERTGTTSLARMPLMAVARFNGGKLHSMNDATPMWVAAIEYAIFTLPIAAGWWRGSRRERQGLVLCAILAAAPILLAVAATTRGIGFRDRYYSFGAAFYCMAAAMGAAMALRHKAARAAWLVLVLGWSVPQLRANYFAPTKPDYATGLRPLVGAVLPGDCAVMRPDIWEGRPHLGFPTYYPGQPFPRVVPSDQLPQGPAGCRRVWWIRDTTDWMNGVQGGKDQVAKNAASRAALDSRFEAVETYESTDVQIILMRPRGQGESVP